MYDLRFPGRNYDSLHAAIKAYGTWGKITESTWAIVTEQTPAQIRDNLRLHIDDNDRLLVVKSGKVAAWKNTIASNEWLQKNLIIG